MKTKPQASGQYRDWDLRQQTRFAKDNLRQYKQMPPPMKRKLTQLQSKMTDDIQYLVQNFTQKDDKIDNDQFFKYTFGRFQNTNLETITNPRYQKYKQIFSRDDTDMPLSNLIPEDFVAKFTNKYFQIMKQYYIFELKNEKIRRLFTKQDRISYSDHL